MTDTKDDRIPRIKEKKLRVGSARGVESPKGSPKGVPDDLEVTAEQICEIEKDSDVKSVTSSSVWEREAGFDRHLVKPINHQQLGHTLAEAGLKRGS